MSTILISLTALYDESTLELFKPNGNICIVQDLTYLRNVRCIKKGISVVLWKYYRKQDIEVSLLNFSVEWVCTSLPSV
jgi:hypothetical protein